MRDVAAYLVTLDIVRGAPSIYATWPGYDEVAHHTGPSTERGLRASREVRPDHRPRRRRHRAQSAATLRPDHPLRPRPVVRRHLQAALRLQPEGVHRAAFARGRGRRPLDRRRRRHDRAGRGRRRAGQHDRPGRRREGGQRGGPQRAEGLGGRRRERRQQDRRHAERCGAKPAAVTVFGSGNLAPVYFHFSNNRVTRPELDATYPGLVHGAAGTRGHRRRLAYEGDGTPIVWGKTGNRNLRTGAVEGDDPLKMYGDPSGARRAVVPAGRLPATTAT